LVAPVLLAASSLHADPAPPSFSAAVELVKVTVTVRDEKGEVVSSLKPEDFQIAEDGEPQQLQFFACALDPDDSAEREGLGAEDREGARRALSLDLGMLLDTSTSMAKELSLSQQAAIRFLDGVPRARELTTLFFDRDIRVSEYESENQQGLFERILETQAGDSTAFYAALATYLSRVNDRPGRKVAVLFTDGVDTTSDIAFGINYPALVEMVRSSSVVIYAIGFKGQNGNAASGATPFSGESILKRLTLMTGGKAFFPRSYRDLPAIYEKILADLGGQYVLGFSSNNRTANGKYRKLRVTVTRPGLKVQHREGYVAPLAPQAALK
jgi:Ca-activated chloride channel family protein